MSFLFRLITAAHARGTHHRLALDGVRLLTVADADKWQRLFLANAEMLVLGSKAPDDEFKDFMNHVLHPRDNFWGGAPVKARSWYGELVESLARADWPAAAWAAGVLSHYVTDPICPFHTAQSEAENAIHRAFEWSVSRSYVALYAAASAIEPKPVNVVDEPTWLEQLICAAALEANQHYEKLIAHYDIHRGVVDPPSGLDSISQKIVGEMLVLASNVFATVLARAIVDAKISAPDVSLTANVVLAALRIPYNSFLKRLDNSQDRAIVEAIYDELKATGTVVENLPEDDRVVRDRYAAEVLAKRPADNLSARFPAKAAKPIETESERIAKQKRLGTRNLPTPERAKSSAANPEASGPELPIVEVPRPAPRAADLQKPAEPVSRFKGEPIAPVAAGGAASAVAVAPLVPSVDVAATSVNEAPPTVIEFAEPVPLRPSQLRSSVQSGNAAYSETAAQSAAHSGGLKIHLTASQDIVDAPSIGPKMAERLRPLGLHSVGDLLLADPKRVADQLGRSDIDADMVRDWQDQARLVCLIPGLRGTHAQLLVGAEFRTAADIAASEPDELCARVLAYASSTAGQRVLRQGEPPDLERIKSWLEGAKQAQAA